MPLPVRIYTAVPCGFCRAAKALLESLDVPFEEIDLTGDPQRRLDLCRSTGMRTVPQVFIGDELVGGYDSLRALHERGELLSRLGLPAAREAG